MEITGIDKMRPFLSYFSALPMIDTGVALMREVCGMSERTDSDLAVPFEALCEAVVFDVTVKKPFFEIVNDSVRYNLHALVGHIRKSDLDHNHQFTYQQAFNFLSSLRFSDCEIVLGNSNLPSATYNSMLNAIEKHDFNLIPDSDWRAIDGKWFSDLWLLSYIIFGTAYPAKSTRFSNQWLKGFGFDEYFIKRKDTTEKDFINRQRDLWSGRPCSAGRSRKRLTGAIINDSEIEQALLNPTSKWNFFAEWQYEIPNIESGRSILAANMAADAIFKSVFDKFSGIETVNEESDFLLSFHGTNPFDIIPLRNSILGSSREMVKIYDLIEPILPQDVKGILTHVLFSCEYTRALLTHKRTLEKIAKNKQRVKKADVDQDYLDAISGFINEYFEVKDWKMVGDMLPSLAKYLQDCNGAIMLRAFMRFLYPQPKEESDAKPNLTVPRLNERVITWKKTPQNFQEAFKLFEDYIHTKQFSDMFDVFKTQSTSQNQFSKQKDVLKKKADSYGLGDWIKQCWSPSSIKKYESKQIKTKN